jgi:hypothetical protein
MTTTAKATAADLILAIDLGKYKSVACLYRSADDHRFLSLATCRQEIARLLDKHQPTVVLIEACLLAGWVHDLCTEQGVTCLTANTASEAWKFKHLKRKTDRDDAQRLAEVYVLGKFPTVVVPSKEVRQKRGFKHLDNQGLVTHPPLCQGGTSWQSAPVAESTHPYPMHKTYLWLARHPKDQQGERRDVGGSSSQQVW